MPKLGQYQAILESVFFLYPDEVSARAGIDAGGTGFFVGIRSEVNSGLVYSYAVTNWHVAVQGNSVIRVNRKEGSPQIFPFEPHEWHFIPNNHDIAVIPFAVSPALKAMTLDAASFFLTIEEISSLEINAAEDIFMLGRFIDYDGIEVNSPSMRFGNISMMAANVQQPTSFAGPSFVVDMHSRTGFSGSPVFIYRTLGSYFLEHPPGTFLTGGGHLMRLLGILWGQFPEEWLLKDQEMKQSDALIFDGKAIKGLSGMSLVSPAWAIRQVLDIPALKQQRQNGEMMAAKQLSGASGDDGSEPT